MTLRPSLWSAREVTTNLPMIRAKALTKYYKSTPALDRLTLEIPDSAVYAILLFTLAVSLFRDKDVLWAE